MEKSDKRFSYTVIGGSVLLTLIIWLMSKWYYNDWFTHPYKYVAKTASLSGSILMCWTLLLAARLRMLENAFGGLDKIYRVHKVVGRAAFWIIMIHPLFLACNDDCDIKATIAYFHFQQDIGFNLGLLALGSFILMMILAVCYFLPYHIWKALHAGMGVVFVLSMLHAILIDKDIARYPLLSLWFYSFVGLSFLSYLYYRFLYPYIGPRFDYVIKNIAYTESVMEIDLTPLAEKMHYYPGQFVYMKCHSPHIRPETHPYSLASLCEAEGGVRLGIKRVGDHTETLSSLKEGDKITLLGPYGKFGEKFLAAEKECVFIGAGIGITPFVSMWEMALLVEKFPPVHLFYVNADEYDASFDNRLKDSAIRAQYKGHEHFQERGHSYELFIGHITAHYLAEKVKNLKECYVFICGPLSLRKDLTKQLKKEGVSYENIISEDFDLRA